MQAGRQAPMVVITVCTRNQTSSLLITDVYLARLLLRGFGLVWTIHNCFWFYRVITLLSVQ